MIALWLALVAWADAPLGAAEAGAEHKRLSVELVRLAERNAWGGAEEAYRGILLTGDPPTFADHVHGAEAARARGEVAAVRERLRAALAVKDDADTREWIAQLDRSYAPVVLVGDAGQALEPARMPFQSDQAEAIRFAQARVAAGEPFDGWLPAGRYTFAGDGFVLRAGAAPIYLDARQDPPHEPPRAPRDPGPAPPLLTVVLGVGQELGALQGGGLGVRVRPIRALSVAGGVGYDLGWTSPGFSGSVRLHPVEFLHVGAGVAPVSGHGERDGVAHGPFASAGFAVGLGPLRVEGSFGAGAAWTGGRTFVTPLGSLGLGMGFGRAAGK